MTFSAAPAMPARTGRPVIWTRGFRLLVASYALLGAFGCAYEFAVSTQPVTIPGDPPVLGSPVIGGIAVAAAVVLAFPWALLPAPLLIVGLLRLRRAGQFRWPLCAAWVVAVVGGAGVEALIATNFKRPLPSPTYAGAPLVSWVSLAEAVAFALVGAAMAAVLASAERTARRQPAVPAAAGRAVMPRDPGARPGKPRTNKLAVAALICTVLPLPGASWAADLVVTVVAVALGLVARRQVHLTGAKGAAVALAAVVIGYIGAVNSGVGHALFAGGL